MTKAQSAEVGYHNTLMLGEILADPEVAGTLGRPDLLTHASPLCWDHILLTGEYSWSERAPRPALLKRENML